MPKMLPNNGKKAKDMKKSFARLLKYLKNFMPLIIVSTFLIIASTIIRLVGPNKLGELTNIVSGSLPRFDETGKLVLGTPYSMNSIWKIGGLLIGLYIFGAVFTYIANYLMGRVCFIMSNNLRREIQEKINKLPLKYIDKVPYGDVLSTVTNDIDIIGQRKPQSYYREIAWELRRDPYIGVRHPGLFDTPYFISGWGFYECDERWCFEGYEGKKAEAYVFADCDEVVLYVNGKEAGRKARQNDGVYKFDVVYEPGEISADAYLGGKKIGTHKIKTEGPVSKIALKQEKSYLKNGARKPERTLIYVDAYAQDEKGSKITGDCRRVSFTAEGAKILGVGSGDLVSKDLYSGNSCNLYKGKCLVALLIEKGARDVTLTANGEGLDPETIKIK